MKRPALAALAALCLGGDAVAQGRLPPGFVLLSALDPGIVQDMRYATADNLIGRPLAGYEDAACILRVEVAQALARVQADLKPLGLGLKVYDCYRPARAVRAMAAWTQDGRADGKRFHPRVGKRDLLNGYISTRSLHSAGIAVDVTLMRLGERPATTQGNADCNAPGRARDGTLDMGTSFDCLDPDSHTHSLRVTAEQRQHRMTLLAAMRKRGFSNYHREWWHFSYGGAPIAFHDFPVSTR